MSSVQWAKVKANTISHPDGASKSPLYTDGIILDLEATATARELSINTTSGELQSNDQGTTRPLMARAAAIDNASAAGDTYLANAWTALTLAWGDYTHKVANPFQRFEGEYERGVCIVSVVGNKTSGTATYVLVSAENGFGVNRSIKKIIKPDSSGNYAFTVPVAADYYEEGLAATQLFIRSDAPGTVSATVNYVACTDGRGKYFT